MLNLNFATFPTLITQRLVLRAITFDDIQDMFEMRSDPRVMQYIPRPIAQTEEDAKAVIQMLLTTMEQKEGLVWGISFRNDTKLLGLIGYFRLKHTDFRAEIGYQLNAKFWQQGIAYETLVPVLNFGFNTMNCHSIEAVIDPDNIGSERVLQKCGFVKEAHFKENCFWDGRFLDSVIYSKLKKY